jgi:glycosyltransferase involved in cell wall biosynthesis
VTSGPAPQVSVIIPCYNAGAFLKESVGTTLAQTFRDLEVVVVDDGSAEKVDWITGLDPARVRYHWKPNGGPSSARNLGARLARAPLLAFLDADDRWYPDGLQERVDALLARPGAAFSYALFDGIDEAGNPRPRKYRKGFTGDIAEALFGYNFVSTSSVVIHREVFEAMKGFDESLIWSEDYDLWMRIVERHEVVFVDAIVGSYRLNSQGLSRNFGRLYETERTVIERTVARGVRPVPTTRVRKRLAQIHFDHGHDCYNARQFAEARKQLASSLRQWPFALRTWFYWLRAALAGS